MYPRELYILYLNITLQQILMNVLWSQTTVTPMPAVPTPMGVLYALVLMDLLGMDHLAMVYLFPLSLPIM